MLWHCPFANDSGPDAGVEIMKKKENQVGRRISSGMALANKEPPEPRQKDLREIRGEQEKERERLAGRKLLFGAGVRRELSTRKLGALRPPPPPLPLLPRKSSDLTKELKAKVLVYIRLQQPSNYFTGRAPVSSPCVCVCCCSWPPAPATIDGIDQTTCRIRRTKAEPSNPTRHRRERQDVRLGSYPCRKEPGAQQIHTTKDRPSIDRSSQWRTSLLSTLFSTVRSIVARRVKDMQQATNQDRRQRPHFQKMKDLSKKRAGSKLVQTKGKTTTERATLEKRIKKKRPKFWGNVRRL